MITSATGIVRDPVFEAIKTNASLTIRDGTVSAPGDAVQRFPPRLALFCIWSDPINPEASERPGKSFVNFELFLILATGVAAPIFHVLFEKPGAIHSKDLQKSFEIAKAKNLNLSVMFQNRYSPEIKIIKEHIAKGYFGRIMSAEARTVTSQVRYRNPKHWLFNKKQSGSGILSWLGCHYLDLLCYVLNDQVVEVSAMVENLNEENLEVEDTAILALKFSEGTIGSLHAGYQLAGSPPGYSGGLYDSHFSIRGTSGYGTIPSNKNTYKFYSEKEEMNLAGIQTMEFSPGR